MGPYGDEGEESGNFHNEAIQGLSFRVQGLGLGCRLQGSGFRG